MIPPFRSAALVSTLEHIGASNSELKERQAPAIVLVDCRRFLSQATRRRRRSNKQVLLLSSEQENPLVLLLLLLLCPLVLHADPLRIRDTTEAIVFCFYFVVFFFSKRKRVFVVIFC